jgi:hypothetical protein
MRSDKDQKLRHPAIDDAATWLIETPRKEIAGNVVQALQDKFGLSVFEAVAACVSAERMRRAAR